MAVGGPSELPCVVDQRSKTSAATAFNTRGAHELPLTRLFEPQLDLKDFKEPHALMAAFRSTEVPILASKRDGKEMSLEMSTSTSSCSAASHLETAGNGSSSSRNL